jgi:hypothetical protein
MGTRVDGIKGLSVLGATNGRVIVALSSSTAEAIGDATVKAPRLRLKPWADVDGEVGERPVRDAVLATLATPPEAKHRVKDGAFGELSGVPCLVPIP